MVAAASRRGTVVTNGMSEYARGRENINGALLVNVTPADFPNDHPLAGIRLQRQLEDAAFALGGGDYRAPCQRVEDFLLHRPTAAAGRVHPSYRPGITYTDLHYSRKTVLKAVHGLSPWISLPTCLPACAPFTPSNSGQRL